MYDIKIKDVNGKETGYMLATDDKGKKMWRVSEAPPLSPRYGSGAVGYEQFPPEQELVWAQDDWSGGFGEFKYKTGSDRYFESHKGDCRYKGQIILGPKLNDTTAIGTVLQRCMCEFNSKFYIMVASGTNTLVYRWDSGTDQEFDQVLTFVATAKNYGLIAYNSWIIAAHETGYYYSTSGDSASWTEVTSLDIHKGQAVINDTLWGADEDGVKSCTDPTASGNWSFETVIGDTTEEIRNIWNHAGVLLIGKDEGLYSIDADGMVANLWPDLQHLRHNSNFFAVGTFQNESYMNGFGSSLVIYSEGTITEISPALFAPDSDTLGWAYPYAITPGPDYLYAILGLTGTSQSDNMLIAGRRQDSGFVWHPLYDMDVTLGGRELRITNNGSSTNPYLFLGVGDTSSTPCYIKLQRFMGSPTNDSSYLYTTTGNVLTGWCDYNLYDVEKAFLYLVVDGDGLSSTEYIDFYYETDDSGTWTIIGRADVDGKTVLSLPKIQVGDETRGPTGRKIRLKIELTTGSSSSTPILRSFSLHAIPAFTPKRQFTFAVQCADEITLLNNTVDNQGVVVIRASLWGYRKEVWPVTLTDIDGVEWQVKLQQDEEEYITKTEGQEPERVIYISAIEAITS